MANFISYEFAAITSELTGKRETYTAETFALALQALLDAKKAIDASAHVGDSGLVVYCGNFGYTLDVEMVDGQSVGPGIELSVSRQGWQKGK